MGLFWQYLLDESDGKTCTVCVWEDGGCNLPYDKLRKRKMIDHYCCNYWEYDRSKDYEL